MCLGFCSPATTGLCFLSTHDKLTTVSPLGTGRVESFVHNWPLQTRHSALSAVSCEWWECALLHIINDACAQFHGGCESEASGRRGRHVGLQNGFQGVQDVIFGDLIKRYRNTKSESSNATMTSFRYWDDTMVIHYIYHVLAFMLFRTKRRLSVLLMPCFNIKEDLFSYTFTFKSYIFIMESVSTELFVYSGMVDITSHVNYPDPLLFSNQLLLWWWNHNTLSLFGELSGLFFAGTYQALGKCGSYHDLTRGWITI